MMQEISRSDNKRLAQLREIEIEITDVKAELLEHQTELESAHQQLLNAEEELLKKAKDQNEEAVLISEIIAAQYELDQLKEEYGLHKEEKGLKKAISNFFKKKEAMSQVPINKKKYVWLAVLLGIFGAHRFYTKQYTTAVIYLLTCWTGYSLSMTIIDLMIVLPKKPDENGNIYL